MLQAYQELQHILMVPVLLTQGTLGDLMGHKVASGIYQLTTSCSRHEDTSVLIGHCCLYQRSESLPPSLESAVGLGFWHPDSSGSSLVPDLSD